jgi:hypothetical protein
MNKLQNTVAASLRARPITATVIYRLSDACDIGRFKFGELLTGPVFFQYFFQNLRH